MKTDINTIYHPCEVLITTLGIPLEYKQKCIEELYNLGDKQNNKTNVKAIMSSYKIWEESRMFDTLINKIGNTLALNIPPEPNFMHSLGDCWGAIYKKDSFTDLHQHGLNNFSFVYYLKASSKSSPLEFPLSNYIVQPKDDLLVIFPSFLPHSVPKQIEDEDRICIAGNFKEIEGVE